MNGDDNSLFSSHSASINGVVAAPPPPEPMFSSFSGVSVDDEAPGLDNGHSLPNVNDLKTSQQASLRTSQMADENGEIKRRGGWMVWLALFLALVVVAVVIAVAVVVTNNKNQKSKSNSSVYATNTGTALSPVPAPVGQKPTSAGKPTGADVTAGVTSAPTSAIAGPTIPPSERLGAIKAYLLNQGISSSTDLDTANSPQALALEFMATGDEMQLQPPAGAWTTQEGYNFVSRYALVTHYYATRGLEWTFDLNFLKPTSICFWYSVLQYADLSTELRGVFCDEKTGQPIALFFNQNNMQGALPPELGFLTTVTNLDLDFNKIGGSIPDNFRRFTSMVNLFAGANRLEGPIPTWIGDLKALKNINFSTNYMTGKIPPSIGTLMSMEGLALDNNLFSSNLDNVFDTSVIPGMRNLEQFYLENNQLTGTLGEYFLREMSNLQYLDVSDGQLKGSIPSHLFTLPKLLVLDLHDNEFTLIPTSFEANTNLAMLALQQNQFFGSVPESISQFIFLNHLDLSQNKFTGEIPSTIANMQNLTYLFLANNQFSKNDIPFWIEQLYQLQELDLKGTQRTGPIPDFLGDLKQLILLDLDDNDLMGTIPTTLGLLENLHILLLNRNNLTSTIPASFSGLKSLKLFYVEANNKIEGNLGDLFCANPLFLTAPVIVANCDICDATPECCALCCATGEECNTGIHVPDLEPSWQLGYNRVFFTFGREEFLNQNRTNPNGGRKLVDQKKLVGASQKLLRQRGSL